MRVPEMNTVYLRITLCLQALVLSAYIFILRIVEETEILPKSELRLPHNLYYLHAFQTDLGRLSGLCYGFSIAAIILAITKRKEFRSSRPQEKIAFFLIIIAPIVISVLGRHQP